MEVSFTNADLAAILLQPQQMRMQMQQQTAVLRAGLDATRTQGDMISAMIVEATKLGGKLDITA
ncbi:MAG: hypothetical protein IT463_13525 [Planctomycetes bacterium]|nr:hypothetical protein [Planctomycetota bacterium]